MSLYWDTETIGCLPSASAIPAGLQRTLEDAFIEINAWVRAPENSNEFTLFFFDDQLDLGTWGKVACRRIRRRSHRRRCRISWRSSTSTLATSLSRRLTSMRTLMCARARVRRR